MEFHKEYLLFIRNRFINKQLIGIIIVVTCYWIFLFSGYYEKYMLLVSNSWIAFLSNLGFILLLSTYFSATIGHAQLCLENQTIPFFTKHSKYIAGLLSLKFWFLFILNIISASLIYWVFIWKIGSFRFYDQAFFRAVYFTLIFAVLAIQSICFASSMKSLPEAKNCMPDGNSLKGFTISLFFSYLTLQVFQYQIQNYLDYLLLDVISYPMKNIFISLGGYFLFSMFFSVIYLESGYKGLMKKYLQEKVK